MSPVYFAQVSAFFGEFAHLFYASDEQPASLEKFQAGRKPGGRRGEGREQDPGLASLRAASQVFLQCALRTCLGFYPAIVHFSTAFAHCGASGEFRQLEYT